MTTMKLRSLALLMSVSVLSAGSASANDIVELLMALRGASVQSDTVPPAYRVAGRDHRVRRVDYGAYRTAAPSNVYGHGPMTGAYGNPANGLYEVAPDPAAFGHPTGMYHRTRMPVGFDNAYDLNRLPHETNHHGHLMPGTPVPPAPAQFGFPAVAPVAPHLHEIGEVVTCPVPLFDCVRVKDIDEICPNNVPAVVAVRDPNLPVRGTRGCVESVVYVPFYAPACPIKKCRVSACGRFVRLDFGQWEVSFSSLGGRVTVNYDD